MILEFWSSTLPPSGRYSPRSGTCKSLQVPACERAHACARTHTHTHLHKITHTLCPSPVHALLSYRATESHSPPDVNTERRPEHPCPPSTGRGEMLFPSGSEVPAPPPRPTPPRPALPDAVAEWRECGRRHLQQQHARLSGGCCEAR